MGEENGQVGTVLATTALCHAAVGRGAGVQGSGPRGAGWARVQERGSGGGGVGLVSGEPLSKWLAVAER